MNAMTTRAERKQKFVLQSIAFITLGVVLIPIWHLPQKTHADSMQAAPTTPLSNALPSLLNDLHIVLSISFLAILVGIAFAFYLEEWLSATNWIRRLIESLVAILIGIPSLAYGILAIGIFFSYTNTLKEIEGLPLSQNVKIPSQFETTVFYAEALTFILMVMPLTIKTTQEALRSVETPIREAAYALGANQWQVLTKQVAPIAFTRILVGGCRAMSRAFAMAALLVGVYTWHHTTQLGGMPSRFILFLTAALFLSIFSSTLRRLRSFDLTQHS
jgi:ABC-type phosphate transport system permease subunit